VGDWQAVVHTRVIRTTTIAGGGAGGGGGERGARDRVISVLVSTGRVARGEGERTSAVRALGQWRAETEETARIPPLSSFLAAELRWPGFQVGRKNGRPPPNTGGARREAREGSLPRPRRKDDGAISGPPDRGGPR